LQAWQPGQSLTQRLHCNGVAWPQGAALCMIKNCLLFTAQQYFKTSSASSLQRLPVRHWLLSTAAQLPVVDAATDSVMASVAWLMIMSLGFHHDAHCSGTCAGCPQGVCGTRLPSSSSSSTSCYKISLWPLAEPLAYAERLCQKWHRP
jgi:hypothetical protein